MKIPLQTTINYLTDCEAVIIQTSGSPLLYPSIDSDDDCFLQLNHTDEDGLVFEWTFFKEDNQEVEVNLNGNIILKEPSGEETELCLLKHFNIKTHLTSQE